MNNQTDWFSKSVGNIVKYGLLLFIVPVLNVACAWLGGVFVKWVFGNEITYALNLLFNTNRFTATDIPWLCAVLALIGGYFHYKYETKTVVDQEKDKNN